MCENCVCASIGYDLRLGSTLSSLFICLDYSQMFRDGVS